MGHWTHGPSVLRIKYFENPLEMYVTVLKLPSPGIDPNSIMFERYQLSQGAHRKYNSLPRVIITPAVIHTPGYTFRESAQNVARKTAQKVAQEQVLDIAQKTM